MLERNERERYLGMERLVCVFIKIESYLKGTKALIQISVMVGLHNCYVG